jgi:hypothetical protein
VLERWNVANHATVTIARRSPIGRLEMAQGEFFATRHARRPIAG